MSYSQWRARATVLIMVGAVGFGSVKLVQARTADDAQLDLGGVTLTAQPIPVQSLKSGLVTAVTIRPLATVKAGQAVGTLAVLGTDRQGHSVTRSVVVRAPAAGVVADQPLVVGQSLQSGQSFLTLYDPAALTLVTDVPSAKVHLVKVGMTATLTSPGLTHDVTAVVTRIMPRVTGTSVSQGAGLQTVLTPKTAADVAALAKLTPGLSFTGTVDTDSGGASAGPA